MSENRILVKYRVTKDPIHNKLVYTFIPNMIYKVHFSHMAMALSRAENFRQETLDNVAHAFKKSLIELQNETVYFEIDQEGMTNEYLRKCLKIAEMEKENIMANIKVLLNLKHKSEYRRKMHFACLRQQKVHDRQKKLE